MEAPAATTFPEAIIVEIIVRLPLRSIARFKSVCKRWKALIESSYLRRAFVSLHKQSSSSWSLMFGTDYPYPIAEAIGLHGCKTWDLPRSLGSYITPFQPHPDPRARVYYILLPTDWSGSMCSFIVLTSRLSLTRPLSETRFYSSGLRFLRLLKTVKLLLWWLVWTRTASFRASKWSGHVTLMRVLHQTNGECMCILPRQGYGVSSGFCPLFQFSTLAITLLSMSMGWFIGGRG